MSEESVENLYSWRKLILHESFPWEKFNAEDMKHKDLFADEFLEEILWRFESILFWEKSKSKKKERIPLPGDSMVDLNNKNTLEIYSKDFVLGFLNSFLDFVFRSLSLISITSLTQSVSKHDYEKHDKV